VAGFIWTTANIAAATKHGVAIADAEYVVRHQAAPWPEAVGEPDVYRVLTDETNIDYDEVRSIDVTDESDVFLVFHARPLTAAEKRRYRQRTKR
jgi:hypothetical protein